MNLPPIDHAEYAVLRGLNIYDAPKLGAKIMGVIPDGTRIFVVAWHMENEYTIYACIGGYPPQWITAYRNKDSYINFIT